MSDWHDLQDEALADLAHENMERFADDLVKRHGVRAIEHAPLTVFGEEPDDVWHDDDLERALRRRVVALGHRRAARLRLPRGHCTSRRLDRRLSAGRPRARAYSVELKPRRSARRPRPAASWVSNTRVTSVSQTRRRIAMSWRPACTTTSISGSASTRASGPGSGGLSPSGSSTSVRTPPSASGSGTATCTRHSNAW